MKLSFGLLLQNLKKEKHLPGVKPPQRHNLMKVDEPNLPQIKPKSCLISDLDLLFAKIKNLNYEPELFDTIWLLHGAIQLLQSALDMLTVITPIKKKNKKKGGFAEFQQGHQEKHRLTHCSRLTTHTALRVCWPRANWPSPRLTVSMDTGEILVRSDTSLFGSFADHTAIGKPSLEVYTTRIMQKIRCTLYKKIAKITWCDMPSAENLRRKSAAGSNYPSSMSLKFALKSNIDSCDVILCGETGHAFVFKVNQDPACRCSSYLRKLTFTRNEMHMLKKKNPRLLGATFRIHKCVTLQ